MAGLRMPVVLLLALALGVASRSSARPQPAAPTEPHLTLTVDPPLARVGQLVTLHIAYSGVGLYGTTITISPDSALAFDPPRTQPCRYDQDGTQCTAITLRALALGPATIHAAAYGEIFDQGCQCWRFTTVNDDGPALLTVTQARSFLALVQR